MTAKTRRQSNLFLIILKVLVSIALIGYLLIFVEEAFPPYPIDQPESNFGMVMVFVLFVWFLVGYYYLWKNVLRSGIFLASWYIMLVITALFIWKYGNVTIVLGIPILILGILLIIHARHTSTNRA
jgi:hypothetical protein